MSTLLVASGFMVTRAVAVGISLSMAPSAVPLGLLKVCSIYKLAAGTTILIVTAILRVTVITFTKERCEWDSGLESVSVATRWLTRTQAGSHGPGYSLKRYPNLSSELVIRDPLTHWTF